MRRREFIASATGLAAAGASVGAAHAVPTAPSRVLVRSYATGMGAAHASGFDAPKVGDRLMLVPDPQRRFDPDSIAIRTLTGTRLGHLPAIHSRILVRLIEHGMKLEGEVVAARNHPRPRLDLDVRLT